MKNIFAKIQKRRFRPLNFNNLLETGSVNGIIFIDKFV